MLINNIRIALRNLLKQPGYTAINVFGLALGLTCTLLIALWVLDEYNYDRFNEKFDRIYRFNADIHFGGADMLVGCGPAPLVPALLRDYPQIEAACRLRDRGLQSIQRGDVTFTENRVMYAEGAMFNVFTLPLVEGDPKTALAEPNTVVVTEKIARKYFGNSSPVGESLRLDNRVDARITGVMRDLPANTHLRGDVFVSMPTLEESREDNWLSNNFSSYLIFREDYNPEAFNGEFEKVIQRYMAPQVEKVMGLSWKEVEASGTKIAFSIMPLSNLHLHGGNRLGDISPNGSIETVRIFSIIAFFILLLAAVNFMNLSTARSAKRAREVGVRKVMGSPKSRLVGQFLTESVLLSLLAGLPALLATRLLLPYFNNLAGKEITTRFLFQPQILLSSLAFITLTGLLAGLYPAFVLSAFEPVKVLKGGPAAGGRNTNTWLRNSLVTFQFAISLMLIIGALITYEQMQFIRNKKLGFERSQVLVLNNTRVLREKAKALKDRILQLPSVECGTIASNLPTQYGHNDQSYFKDRDISPENGISMRDWWTDADFFKTMKIPFVEGRNFDPLSPADSNAIIINQRAAKMLGYTNPLDKKLYNVEDISTKAISELNIIGVVQDFHYESLRDEIAPIIMHREADPEHLAFRLKTDDYSATVAQVKSIWQEMAPGLPFHYEFMDEQFDQMYRSEKRAGLLVFLFAGLAVAIACLGLFGLAAFTAEQRTKEIGVRKVLGASVTGITRLLTGHFLRLVVIAFVIASPIAYYFMQKWLADFAYRIEISWWMFALAGVLAVLIAFLTVSFQSIRAALANPVKSLRSE